MSDARAVPPQVLGDPLRLGQVLLNLVGNAIKFTAKGGIQLRVQLQAQEGDNATLSFEVRDSGIGISHEDLPRLFNAFEQADGSMTRKYGGTGPGLAISKRLVRMMCGEIEVRSQLGQGSRFWFTIRQARTLMALPAEGGTEFSSTEAQLRQHFGGARVLLAEDEPINQEVPRGLLEEVGLHVDVAEDGQMAVDMVQTGHYDLILLDIQMPVLNGLAAARAIRGPRDHRQTGGA